MNSSTNDVGNIIKKPMRMCGFVPVNVPIIYGLMMAPPTMGYTAFFQWANQTYNSGLNFGNSNSSCSYSNQDLMKGYCTAVTSAVTIALLMRKMTAGMIVGMKGKRLLLVNFAVSVAASMSANFCNSLCMRYPEIKNGIEVYADEILKTPAGISQKCAESAVYETAYSRVAMSFLTLSIPVALTLGLPMMLGIKPRGRLAKNVF